MDATITKPQGFMNRVTNEVSEGFFTYNQAGFTYNEAGYTYGGADRRSASPPSQEAYITVSKNRINRQNSYNSATISKAKLSIAQII